MATTFTLLSTGKIDTRRDGAISFVQASVEVDGAAAGATFRARVGEEPIVIDGDTITVSDVQAASVRRAAASLGDRVAAQDVQIARFGPLAEIVATSDAQRRYAEDSRRTKLPLIAASLDATATKFATDPARTARAFAHVAAQADAHFWIDTATGHEAGVGGKLYAAIWYHFA